MRSRQGDPTGLNPAIDAVVAIAAFSIEPTVTLLTPDVVYPDVAESSIARLIEF
jgi:hypothetical protein